MLTIIKFMVNYLILLEFNQINTQKYAASLLTAAMNKTKRIWELQERVTPRSQSIIQTCAARLSALARTPLPVPELQGQ